MPVLLFPAELAAIKMKAITVSKITGFILPIFMTIQVHDFFILLNYTDKIDIELVESALVLNLSSAVMEHGTTASI